MPCNVLVLPVPVAPATRPCRFIIDSGRPTGIEATASPSTTSAPSGTVGPANA